MGGERADPRTRMCFLGERGEGGGIVDILYGWRNGREKFRGWGGELGAGLLRDYIINLDSRGVVRIYGHGILFLAAFC